MEIADDDTTEPFENSVDEEENKGENTPGTRGWSRLHDRTLAVPKKRAKICLFFREKKIPFFFFFRYSFSYAKILGETNLVGRTLKKKVIF